MEKEKHVPREQQIANGLKRGELLAISDCGCTIIQDRTADAYIIYCSKHEAAPDLLEALQKLIDKYIANPNTPHEFISCLTPEGIPDYWRKAQEAIAKATGELTEAR